MTPNLILKKTNNSQMQFNILEYHNQQAKLRNDYSLDNIKNKDVTGKIAFIETRHTPTIEEIEALELLSVVTLIKEEVHDTGKDLVEVIDYVIKSLSLNNIKTKVFDYFFCQNKEDKG